MAGHLRTKIAAVTLGAVALSGCGASAHVSIGGSPSLSKSKVETNVANTLASSLKQPVPTVVCPGRLKGKVGTVMFCNLTPQNAPASATYPVKLDVYAVQGTDVRYHITVSQTPGHYTEPPAGG